MFHYCVNNVISVNVLYSTGSRPSVVHTVFGITTTLMYLNSTLNPWLYMFRMKPLRSAVVSIIQVMRSNLTG